MSFMLSTFFIFLLMATFANLQEMVENSSKKWNSDKLEKIETTNESDKSQPYIVVDRKSLIKKQLSHLSLLLKQSKEQKVGLKNDFERISKLINDLELSKWNLEDSIGKIMTATKQSRNQQIEQLTNELKEINLVKNELNLELDCIKEVLTDLNRNNETVAKNISTTFTQICNRSLEEFYKTEEPDFTWTINDLKHLTEQRYFSEVFPLRGYPFGAEVILLWSDVNFSIDNSYKSRQSLNFEVAPTVYYTFKNPDQNPGAYFTMHKSQGFNSVYDEFANYNIINYHSVSRSIIERHLNLNKSLTIDVHVEPAWLAEQSCSYDGTLTWAINNFKERVELEKSLSVLDHPSPYFYTSPKGFKVQFLMSLRDWGFEGDHGERVGLVANVKGPFDKILDESKNFKFTLTLLHTTDPAKHKVISFDTFMGSLARIFIRLVTLEEMENLLVDDTLYYNVSIVAI